MQEMDTKWRLLHDSGGLDSVSPDGSREWWCLSPDGNTCPPTPAHLNPQVSQTQEMKFYMVVARLQGFDLCWVYSP